MQFHAAWRAIFSTRKKHKCVPMFNTEVTKRISCKLYGTVDELLEYDTYLNCFR